MSVRTVSYVRCKSCGNPADVQFAHGAIQVEPCRKCCSLMGILRKFFKNRPPRGT